MSIYRSMLPALALAGVMLVFAAPEAWAQTATNLKCKKCVGKSDLAKNAVTGKQIKNGSVALGDLSPAVQQVIASLQIQVTALQAQVAAVQGDPVFALSPFVTVDEVATEIGGTTQSLPRVLFEGVNVQVVNGDASQATDSLNGLGNLIVGYNEPRNFGGGGEVCSNGEFFDESGCVTNGHVWAENHKSGSHNLVVGARNAYSQANGVVFGSDSAINSLGATVTGGHENNASGEFSSVSGGEFNTAAGSASSVSGGDANFTGGNSSSISGGEFNFAGGISSSVGGGEFNEANGDWSSVSGGESNTANGDWSSVSGGFINSASGGWSSINGGEFNTASGGSSSASGGNGVTISGECDWGGVDMVLGDGSC